jgi:hypothetical protein
MNKLQILQAALEPRNDEILNYQINIDNYTRAIDKIDAQYANNPDLIEFRDKLTTEVKNHKTEQLKSIIIRDVITDQINELETKSITEEAVRESLETLVTNDAHA